MKRVVQKIICFVLILSLLLSPHLEVFGQESLGYERTEDIEKPQRTRETDPDDIFDVYVSSGTEHVGYIFRLVEGAFIPFAENENIDAPFTIYVYKNLTA